MCVLCSRYCGDNETWTRSRMVSGLIILTVRKEWAHFITPTPHSPPLTMLAITHTSQNIQNDGEEVVKGLDQSSSVYPYNRTETLEKSCRAEKLCTDFCGKCSLQYQVTVKNEQQRTRQELNKVRRQSNLPHLRRAVTPSNKLLLGVASCTSGKHH